MHVAGIAVAVLLLGLMPLGGVAHASRAPEPRVSVATGITALSSESVNVPTTVSGFYPDSRMLMAVVSVPVGGGLLSIDTDPLGSLQLSYGYADFANQSSIGFYGPIAEVTAALANDLTWTPGTSPQTQLSVSVSEHPGKELFYNGENGHYYLAVASPGIRWTTARDDAQTHSLYGLTGYLATITSAAENSFITNYVDGSNLWIGATDSVDDGAPVPGTWVWADGPEAGTQFWTGTSWTGQASGTPVAGQFSSWRDGEPNMYNDAEYYAVTNYFGSGLWNDYPDAEGSIGGYLIEFGGVGTSYAQAASTTAELSVTPRADLAVTVRAPSTVAANGALSADVTATNDGPDDATGVTLTADVSHLSAATTTSPGCTVTGTTLTCGPEPLANGASRTASVTGTAPGWAAVMTTQASVTSTSSDNDASNDAASATTTVSAPPALGAPAAGLTPAVRLGGADRAHTAIAVSTKAYPVKGSAKSAVLASQSTFVDALTGGPLAAAKHGPLLLTSPTSLPAAVTAELQRVLPAGATVYILGSQGAVSAHVEAAVQALGFRAVRLGGVDRYATGIKIAQALGNPSVVFEVSGLDFADAMSAGPAAVATGAAVLLTQGTKQSAANLAYLKGRTTTRYAVGGQAAAADASATPIVGPDRAATSVKVAQQFFPKPQGVGVAIGNDFPDALVAAPYLGSMGHPLLLVDRSHGPSTTVTGYLTTHSSGIGQVTVFGGTGSISDDVLRSVQISLP